MGLTFFLRADFSGFKENKNKKLKLLLRFTPEEHGPFLERMKAGSALIVSETRYPNLFRMLGVSEIPAGPLHQMDLWKKAQRTLNKDK